MRQILIEHYKKEVEEALKSYLAPRHPVKIWEAMAYTCLLPGKRLRPILLLESCRVFSGDHKIAIPAACAVEMLHAQSLIHDDLPCMDNDDFRRGQPSNHKVFGEALAVLAGDALLTLAPQIIMEETDKSVSPQILLKIIHQYCVTAGAMGLVGGQVLDILSEGKEIDLDTLEYIHNHKTGMLFKFALSAGALLGGADEKQLAAMVEFGKLLGFAFQISDDILDKTSNYENLGKTVGKDAVSEKMTYVKMFGLEKSQKDTISLIDKACDILKKAKINSRIFDEISNSVKERING